VRALLLAAGLGTRLRPLTDNTPKCLVPIHGRPLLDYWLEMLLGAQSGVDRVLINTSYLAEQVQDHVMKSPWRERIDLTHEDELLQTGGTVLANRAFFNDDAFMVIHADNLSRFSVADFIACHHRRPAEAAITMMTFVTDAPSTCGIIEADERGLIIRFHEKVSSPPSNRANGAVYIFEPEVLDFMNGLGKRLIDLSTEVIPSFMGRIAIFENRDYHRDIGTIESLEKAHREYPLLSSCSA
jgi:mannose-1-phosphate guanylyltransferase